jgi:hypothetical protein
VRPAWHGSDRRERLPDNWDELRAAKHLENPEHTCHWCGHPGGEDLDHVIPGDDHRLENLDWIHGRRSYEAGLSVRNCHGEKSGREGAEARAARPRRNRPPEVHPALR